MPDRSYRILEVNDVPTGPNVEFSIPKSVFTLSDVALGGVVRVMLPRRGDWRVGDVVRVSEATLEANKVERRGPKDGP